jgi:mono/diheme cytochrome c family protein
VAYVGEREARGLRQSIDDLATKLEQTDAIAAQANASAARAAELAGQTGTIAARANRVADQAQQLATTAQAAANRAESAATAAASLAVAQQTRVQQVPPAPSRSQIAEGRDLALQVCAACHVVSPDQHFAPTLRPPAPDFRSIVNRPTTTDTSLHDFILTPHGKMPDLTLVGYQVAALVSYMISLRDHR